MSDTSTHFWNESIIEPKRGFRWTMIIPAGGADGNPAIQTYVIRNVKKPSFTITETPVQYIAHTFKYPGRLTWADITCTLVDPVSPDTSSILTKMLGAAGYRLPEGDEEARFSFAKRNANSALGDSVVIQQLDGGNPGEERAPKVIESWTLKNAWVKSMDFGTLDYSNENLVEIALTLAYDYAEYRGSPAIGPNGPIGGLKDVMVAGKNK